MKIIVPHKKFYIAKHLIKKPVNLKSKLIKMMFKFIILLCVLYFFAYVRGQTANQRSAIRCPNVFSYVRTDTGLVGKVTINFIPAGTHHVKVVLSQTPPIEPPEDVQKAKLSLYHTAKIVQGRLSRGEPIAFRVIFPTPGVIPRVTHISLDNRVLCTGTPYPPPATNIELWNNLSYANVPNKQVRLLYSTDDANLLAETPDETKTEAATEYSISKFWKTSMELPQKSTTTTPPPSLKPRQRPPPDNSNFQCGQEGHLDEPVLVPLILGGEDIEKGQFPWLATIKHQDSYGKWVFKCGGTLIGARAVITAAHCLHDATFQPTPVLAELGRYNIDTEREDHQIAIPTQRVLMHPDYRKNSFPDADIGIVLLSQAIQFTQYVQPICFWSGSVDLNEIVGNMGVVAGWGIDESGLHSSLPKKIAVPVASELDCRKSTPAVFNLLTDRTLCAGRRDGSGPLKGDSGGALMIKRNGRWTLRAIVSVGINSGKDEQSNYVIYCDAAKFGDWIRSSIE